jgi:hypothetical protein
MSERSCAHPDIRKFDGIRCCLACGEAVFEALFSNSKPLTEVTNVRYRYRYTKLNYKLGREIRLVVLLPGEPADPIRCEIVHVNLDDDPIYDAVSYTWATEDGDASLSQTIQCVRGGFVSVTVNCDAVLRQLRQTGLSRRLWIDAICTWQSNYEQWKYRNNVNQNLGINQASITERNHQVGFMGLIFSGARSVRICVHDSSRSDYNQLTRWLCGPIASNCEHLEESLTRSVMNLVSLRYFSRAWVIQEIALSRAAYLLVNDQELLLTSTIMDRLTVLCRRISGKVPSVLRWYPGRHVEIDIVTCLDAGMSCNVTDPRDRVFAVLSLMNFQARSLISADYSLDHSLVYTNAIVAIIITRQTLEILLYASINNTSSSEDWRTRSCFDLEQLQSYLAACHFAANNQFEGEIEGPWWSVIDVNVVPASDYHEVDHHGSASCIIMRPQPTHTSLLPRLRVRAHYIDCVEQTNICSKSLVSDFGYTIFTSSPRSVYSPLAEFFRASVPLSDVSPQASDVILKDDREIRAADIIAFVREGSVADQMFASHYSVGFASSGVEKGDAIFAIDGARKPFILRKAGAQSYRIVGQCYLWAALELDCWNPGTEKGRWGPDVERPTGKQTQIIEIH